jgi:hypothetical protein
MPNSNRALVVGLLPPQARKVAEAFPGCGLKFMSREREREVGAVAESFDHVVLMTKFISHKVQDQVPREKRELVNGGITDLRRRLKQILTPVKIEATKTVEPKPSAERDFSFLKDSKVGEVLHFKRPSDTSRDTWTKQVSAVRSYYRLRHGVITEGRTVEDGVMVTITARRAPEVADASYKAPEAAPAAAPEAPLMVASNSEQRAFWRETFLRYVTALPGATAAELAAKADAAVAVLALRFPEAP